MPRTLLPAVAVLAAALAPSRAVACEAARSGPMAASVPAPFRDAVSALVASTREPGAPWSCAGGAVEVVERAGRFSLAVVHEDGRRVEREVESPDEVVPLGQALLSAPLPPPGDEPPAFGDDPEPHAPSAAAGQEAEPRVRVGLVAAPRYAGGTGVTWGGLALDAAIPFGPWSFGVYGRADSLLIDTPPTNPTLREIALGAEIRRAWSAGPVLLEPGARASLALLSRDEGRDGSETQMDGRLGAALRCILPLSPLLRAVALADAEIAPAELGGSSERVDADDKDREEKPPFPGYTLGLGIGLEVVLR